VVRDAVEPELNAAAHVDEPHFATVQRDVFGRVAHFVHALTVDGDVFVARVAVDLVVVVVDFYEALGVGLDAVRAAVDEKKRVLVFVTVFRFNRRDVVGLRVAAILALVGNGCWCRWDDFGRAYLTLRY